MQVTKSKTTIELYLQLITVQAHISGLRSAMDKQEARAGAAWAWEARPAHLLYRLPSACASWHQPASHTHGLERPLRLAADAAMFFRQALLPLPQQRRRQRRGSRGCSHRCSSRASQHARSQQAAAMSIRQPWSAARGLHGGRNWRLGEARSPKGTWRPPRRRRSRDGQRHEKLAENRAYLLKLKFSPKKK